MEISVSFWTFLWSALSFVGVYVLIPSVMVLRDFLLILLVEKLVLNGKFWFFLRVFCNDKLYLEQVYNRNTFHDGSEGEDKYIIDGQDVSKEVYDSYHSSRNMCLDCFRNSKLRITLTKKLVIGIDKYFKADTKFEDLFNSEMERFTEESIAFLNISRNGVSSMMIFQSTGKRPVSFKPGLRRRHLR
jgi:hypothetical protein